MHSAATRHSVPVLHFALIGLHLDAAALRKQVNALGRMGGQALAGGNVGMVAADEVDVFIGGVQLALLGCGGDAGRGGLD